MTDNYDKKLLDEFVAENRDHLESIEPDLLAMERLGSDVTKDILNRVFRAIHSVKGSSGFFNLTAIMNLSHVMENLLMCFRDGELYPDPDKIDSLLCGVDKLRLMLNDVQASDRVSIDDELLKINECLSGTKGEIKKSAAGVDNGASEKTTDLLESLRNIKLDDAVMNLDKAVLKEATSEGMYIYAFSGVNLSVTDLESYGRVLFHGLDAESSENRLIYATAMEKDLLCDFSGLTKDRVVHLDYDSLYKTLNEKACAAAQETKPSEPGQADLSSKDEQKDKKTGTGEVIRVGADIVDRLMNLVGELVLTRNQLKRELESIYFHDPKIRIVAQNLNTVTSKIQGKIMQMRLQPIGVLFQRFPRIIRDNCRRLSKKADLRLGGEEVELDKSLVENLFEPIGHLLENAVVHGIESIDERKRLGKSEVGQISVNAFMEGGLITLIISDDGCGMDSGKIASIFSLGASQQQKNQTDSHCCRGVEAIKNSIEKLGGTLDIDSVADSRTTVRIRLPLTITIIPSIIIDVHGKRFAVPQVNVTEIVNIKPGEKERKIEKVGSAEVMRLRGKLLPLLKLSDALGIDRNILTSAGDGDDSEQANETFTERQKNGSNETNVIVMRIGSNRMGLVVDNIFDTEEIVVKPLSDFLKDCQYYAGSTILGDGRVAMILDVAAITRVRGFRFDDVEAEAKGWKPEDQLKKRVFHKSFILFNNSHDDYFAVPLEGVSKIEKVGIEQIYRSGNRYFMDYIGKALPLLSFEKTFHGAADHAEIHEFYVIIPKNAELRKGILVSRMPDTIYSDVEIVVYPSIPQCIAGVAFFGYHLIRFLNIEEILRLSEVPLNYL